MVKKNRTTNWAGVVARGAKTLTRIALRVGRQVAAHAAKPALGRRRPALGAGDWIAGVAIGATGACRYHLYRPPGTRADESLPLMVMLHGCGQDAKGFAASTRMNALATRERCLVLYPEQERVANAQGCWNWFEMRSGRAQVEAAAILAAIDQVIVLYRADRERVAICGLSAGASMAALVASRYPDRLRAVVMHSGVRTGVAQSSAGALAAMQGQHTSTPASLLSALPDTGLKAPAAALPPLLVIQGSLDRIVAPVNGRAAALAWAQAHAGVGTGAAGVAVLRESAARRVQRGKRLTMRVVDFKQGARALATLVEIDGLGHAWSGGAADQPFSDATGPDVSRMAWAFAAKQFRIRAAAVGKKR